MQCYAQTRQRKRDSEKKEREKRKELEIQGTTRMAVVQRRTSKKEEGRKEGKKDRSYTPQFLLPCR